MAFTAKPQAYRKEYGSMSTDIRTGFGSFNRAVHAAI
jgi:hypothetical protein